MQGTLKLDGGTWTFTTQVFFSDTEYSDMVLPLATQSVTYINDNGGEEAWDGVDADCSAINVADVAYAQLDQVLYPETPEPPVSCQGPKDWNEIYTDYMNDEGAQLLNLPFKDWLQTYYYSPFPL